MSTEIALYFHLHEETGTETRVARAEDAQGVYDVLDSFGWQTASVEQRLAWYKVNPFIDYVVAHNGAVIGYITAVPYTPEALADMMAGRKRAWHIKPADIKPYRAGESYDLYIGIAVRQDLELHTRYAARLISGFLSFLIEMAGQGIMVRCLHAVSAEEPGQRFCRALGFVERPNEAGELDAFTPGKPLIRFVLDLETSDSHFAQLYRATIEKRAEPYSC